MLTKFTIKLRIIIALIISLTIVKSYVFFAENPHALQIQGQKIKTALSQIKPPKLSFNLGYQSARVPTTPPFNKNNSNNSNNPLPTMGFDQLTKPPPGQKTTPVPTGGFYPTPTGNNNFPSPTKSPGTPTNTPRPQPSSTPKPTATRSRPQLLHTSDQDQACGKFSKTSVKESVFQPLF